MSERPSPSVEHALEQLRCDYVRSLPAKLATLRDQVDAARAGHDQEQIDTLLRLAHTLKGTSGTYGLAHITREMRAVEEACERLLQERSNAAAWRDLGHALARAEELAPDRPSDNEPKS